MPSQIFVRSMYEQFLSFLQGFLKGLRKQNSQFFKKIFVDLSTNKFLDFLFCDHVITTHYSVSGFLRHFSSLWKCFTGFLSSRALFSFCALYSVISERHIPKNRRPMHHPPLRSVVIYRVMLGNAVIPERHVIFLPAPANGELRAGCVGE